MSNKNLILHEQVCDLFDSKDSKRKRDNVGDREKAGQLPANEKQKKEKEREGHAFSAALNHLRDQTL